MHVLIDYFKYLVEIITDPIILFNMAWATLLGMLVGTLPGLTATLGVAILTTLTFGFPTKTAIGMLVGVYIGAIYGGSRTAIVLNIPGTPANAATTVDGFPLARSGQAGFALNVATIMSGIGSIIGAIFIVTLAPLLGKLALEFGSWEFAVLAVFGTVIAGSLTAPKDPLKGWIAGFLGLMISQIGLDEITSFPRYTFGNIQLYGGIALLPVLVGVYGIPEILMNLKRTTKMEVALNFSKNKSSVSYGKTILKNWINIIRSGIVGVFIGVIPGVGEDVSSWVSYDLAKRSSKEPEKFGQGSLEGLTAAETANNACVAGAIIPVLTLAVPGSAPAAVLLAALWIHGVRAGPLLPIEHPEMIGNVAAMFTIATILMVIFGLLVTRLFLKILLVPTEILMPIIFVLCVVGTYVLNGRMFDVWIMLLFGLLGYFMRLNDFPAAPFVLGFILGPMADTNLRRALMLSKGSLLPFFTRPISLILLIAMFLVMFSKYFSRKRGAKNE
ncbi:tripartite tricarboxylate transporter permease [Pseudothermotoga sp.]|uniref:tripartite tricarboxylate transporter permease n=1 Tax=Pseudothermotoga sp. TaxID=2033661 RepID=UPI00258B8FDB|nr:tripartite tricarboxylate transporter permease [Pseudothermotoga sp.]MDK2883624.1 putative tricarboxylic transport rane protein [Pseudothermotoga sp.]